MATTIRTPGVIDLTEQRIQVGDTVAFVEKINTTQQKLEQWTAQDWNNFASDVAAVAGELETARDQSVTAKNQAVAAQGASEAARDESVTAKNQAVAAQGASEAARDESVTAKNQAVAAQGASETARDESVTAKNQAVAAQGASETARDQSVTAKDQALAAVAAITDQPGLIAATEAATGGRVTVRFTTKGQPCFFYKIPAFNCEDVAPDGSLGAGVHPAFIKNGVQEPYILRAVYPAALVDGELVSQPGRDPITSRTYDQQLALAAATGPGFEIDDNMGWAATALWCVANNYQPAGNTNFGRHHERRWETAQRSDGLPAGTTATGGRTLTGTGPATWNHDGTPAGISDLVGNVWERCTGLKLIDGVFHIAPDGGTHAESEYVNTGVSAPAEGTFSSRPNIGVSFGAAQTISGWSFSIYCAVVAADGSILVVGTNGQYARSTNNGVSFGAIQTISGWSAQTYSAVVAADGSILVVGTNGQYARSTNNGVSFGAAQTISGWTGIIRSAVVATDGSVLVAGDDGRYARSTNNGVSFGAIQTISGLSISILDVVVAADGSILAVGVGGRYARSTNNGVSFGAVQTVSGWSFQIYSAVVATGGSILVVGDDGQYARSTNNGTSFGAVQTISGWSAQTYSAVVAADGSILVVGANGQYARSTNNGVSFGAAQTISGWTDSIRSAVVASNGSILVVGDGGRYVLDFTILLRRALAIPASPSMAPAGYFWRTTTGERVALRGTGWYDAGGSGLGALALDGPRSAANSHIGCRLRFRDQ